MGVDEVFDDMSEIKKVFCSFGTAEVSFGFNLIFDVLIILFDWVFVMFASVFFVCDRNARNNAGDSIEVVCSGCFVVCESIADEGDELSFFCGFLFLLLVLAEYLFVASVFDLFH